MAASSMGAYINKHIKPRFPFRLVDERDSTQ
jgi:hypothetical protein